MTDAALSPAQPARAAPAAGMAAGVRITEIDMLRGLVIVLMALDHVRDYFYLAGGFAVNPLDPDQTTPWLYITRWITHLCAPTFVLLAGVSAYLQFAKGKPTPKLSVFLLTRGLWLIVLEATVLSFGWSFAAPWLLFLQVIWAIGWSMIALAALVWLPRIAVLLIGLAIVCGHNLLDPITAQQFGSLGWLWQFAHEGGPIFVGQAPIALAAYPILPWIGVIAVGYGMGALFASPPEKRDRTLFLLGLAMLAAFLVLRGFNLYGNPPAGLAVGPFGGSETWQSQETFGAALMLFFNVQKYPPSLQFLLVTLGIVFTLFPLLTRLRGPVASVLNTFGAVPFFFYVLHVYVVHLLAMAANAALGRDASGFLNYLVNGFIAPERLAHLGFTLPWVYVAWITVLAILYPLCRYWQGLKARRRDWWLSYL
jgi:uncharacterized membrane protein